ncbi:MAG: hypothetical protein IJI45_18390 [Anaerolineaceae bacterium]|nr:hypothetical protein [Anaerolineaceae bacterium]
MAKAFVVGKKYLFSDSGFDPVEILRRTDKTVWVKCGRAQWFMRIRHDEDGCEYVIDSSSSKRYRELLRCSAKWEDK